MLFHGALLAQGMPGGADDLNLWDAACLVAADYLRRSEQTSFTYNHENAENFRDTLAGSSQTQAENALDDVAAMRAEMEQQAGVAAQNAAGAVEDSGSAEIVPGEE